MIGLYQKYLQDSAKERKRQHQKNHLEELENDPDRYVDHLLSERTRQSSDPYKERKRERESSIEYKLKKQARKQRDSCGGNISNLDGFGLYPKSINKDIRNELLGYLQVEFSATRIRSRNESAIIQMDYGREFIIQTRAFCEYVLENRNEHSLYTRTPHSAKYSVPINTIMLEDEKQLSVMKLSRLVQLIIPQVRDLVLYIVQCIVYDGAGSRGPHVDGLQNGGDVIVGCDIGGCKRLMGIGKDHTFQIGIGSIYVMYDDIRYNCNHDPRKVSKRDCPHVIMFRYGLQKQLQGKLL